MAPPRWITTGEDHSNVDSVLSEDLQELTRVVRVIFIIRKRFHERPLIAGGTVPRTDGVTEDFDRRAESTALGCF